MERLPDELLLLIFNYLHKIHILYSFNELNSRFQQIIRPYQSDIKLENPLLKQFYQSRTNENIFLALLNLPSETIDSYGGFNEIWLLYKFLDETTLFFEWIGLNKTATRLAEASMIKFLLPMNPSCTLNQYDTKIDVQQTAIKSSYS